MLLQQGWKGGGVFRKVVVILGPLGWPRWGQPKDVSGIFLTAPTSGVTYVL